MFAIKYQQKGVSLYLTIAMLAVLMTSLLAMIGVSISQIKTIQAIGDSVVAFYGADTGIERVLYALYQEGYDPQLGCPYSGTQNINGHTLNWEVCVSQIDPDPMQMRSTGVYKKTQRSIEINFK